MPRDGRDGRVIEDARDNLWVHKLWRALTHFLDCTPPLPHPRAIGIDWIMVSPIRLVPVGCFLDGVMSERMCKCCLYHVLRFLYFLFFTFSSFSIFSIFHVCSNVMFLGWGYVCTYVSVLSVSCSSFPFFTDSSFSIFSIFHVFCTG